MQTSIRVTVKHLEKVNDKIRSLFERIKNPAPLLNDIANYMVRVTQNRITTTKTAPDGTKWARNSDLTRDLKGGSSVLYASGNLASSIAVLRRDRHGFSIGSKLPYAAPNQNGVKIMKGKYKSKRPSPQIPARPFLGFSESNKTKIAKMMREYIKSGRDTQLEDGE